MPRKAPTLDTPFRRGEKVRTTRELPGLAEGTQGKVKLINGLDTWIRYWVRFDDGRMVGQVDHNDLVRLDQLEAWRELQEARAAAAAAAAADTASPDVPAAAAGDGGGGVASLVPAHLLERSKAAKARLLG